MDKDENDSIIQALSKSALCKEFTQDELLSLLEENNTEIKKYEKGSFVFEEGDVPDRLYVLIYGLVEVSKLTFSGKKILITTIENPGDMFSEVYMFMGKSKYDMSAQTGEESLILSISSEFFENISYNTNALAAEKIRKNLMSIFAMKAYNLSGKVRLLGCGSIREKISLYLIENQTPSGEIAKNPSREELADYLNVTRPSLSRELGNMEKEGIIRLDGRKIVIVSQEKLEEYL
ncbi:Crp/Fnr family transcriptional regulator [Butyribacter sp.]|uniref:Crp/Fnr family transcriptional regulator n=1 Tax=Butyribacter sp. TaxID=2822465 RepID=UPI002A99ACE4|nr:Crp/Fnr family transcriptional regulator [Butyribacter sp.]